MFMSNNTKINWLLLLTFIGVWTCMQLRPKDKKDEIIIDSIHVPKNPCISAINDLLGKGVDSSKACDCLLPRFYNLIKKDSSLVIKFREYRSLFKLEGVLKDSFNLLFAKCVKENILDSNYVVKLTPEYQLAFKEKLKRGFQFQNGLDKINTDILSDCIVEKLNDNITIGEYFSDDYFEVPKIKKIMLDCIDQSKK